jgi:hypothetical protein
MPEHIPFELAVGNVNGLSPWRPNIRTVGRFSRLVQVDGFGPITIEDRFIESRVQERILLAGGRRIPNFPPSPFFLLARTELGF